MASEEDKIAAYTAGSVSSSSNADLEQAPPPRLPEEKDAIPEGDETMTLDSKREGLMVNPFENDANGETEYRTLTWLNAGFLLVAETISLGILSLPAVVASMGFVPGVILIVFFGVLTTYTGYITYQVKIAFPGIHNFADAGLFFFGRWAKEVSEAAQIILLVFIMSAHILTFSIMMNVLTNHGTCTIVFTVVGMVVSMILCIPRTMKNVALMSIASCLSIATAIFIAMIGIGVDPPAGAHAYAVTPSSQTSFRTGVVAVANILVSFCSNIAYFGFISEMKTPRDFPKALAMLQTCTCSLYIIVAVVIYRFAGTDVKSPAIGSASPTVRKVAYGIAIPTIVVAGVIYAHVATKNVYVRIWRKTNVMNEKSFRSLGSWYGLTIILWVVAWVIANAIPVFSQLLGLLGSLFCTWFSMILPAAWWIMMNKRQLTANWEKISLTIVNIIIALIGLALCGLGVWGSAVDISENSGSASAFSCGDNS
ncbi:putative amino acid transporter [Aureobasidium subglaciale]|nr:putative amino acid transporter [Aureobasidium subglaciale]